MEDIDKVMTEGLGMRYAFLGPLETAHLNAEGSLVLRCSKVFFLHHKCQHFVQDRILFIKTRFLVAGMANYCERYSNSIYNVCQTMPPPPKFEGSLVKEMNNQLVAKVPLNKLQERRDWRDHCLMGLSQLKKNL